MRAIAACSYDIHRPIRGVNPGHRRAHRADRANNFRDGFAARSQSCEKARHPNRACVAAQHFRKGSLDIFCRVYLAVDGCADQFK